MQELLQQEFSVYLASIARIQHTLSQEYEQLRIDNEQLRREIELKDEQLRVERDRLTQADDLLRAVLRECVFSSMPTDAAKHKSLPRLRPGNLFEDITSFLSDAGRRDTSPPHRPPIPYADDPPPTHGALIYSKIDEALLGAEYEMHETFHPAIHDNVHIFNTSIGPSGIERSNNSDSCSQSVPDPLSAFSHISLNHSDSSNGILHFNVPASMSPFKLSGPLDLQDIERALELDEEQIDAIDFRIILNPEIGLRVRFVNNIAFVHFPIYWEVENSSILVDWGTQADEDSLLAEMRDVGHTAFHTFIYPRRRGKKKWGYVGMHNWSIRSLDFLIWDKLKETAQCRLAKVLSEPVISEIDPQEQLNQGALKQICVELTLVGVDESQEFYEDLVRRMEAHPRSEKRIPGCY